MNVDTPKGTPPFSIDYPQHSVIPRRLAAVNQTLIGGGSIFDVSSSSVDLKQLMEGLNRDVHKALGGSYRETIYPPAIIAPMLGKTSVYPVIAHQWNCAISAISNAKYIWVIGYSFPLTDVFMPRLFTEGLKNNDDLRGMYIVDIRPFDNWRIRLSQMFNAQKRRRHIRFMQAPSNDFIGSAVNTPVDKWPTMYATH